MNLIISARNNLKPADDIIAARRHAELGVMLAHYGKCSTVLGCYQGKLELAWHVEDCTLTPKAIQALAIRFHQESFMVYWPKAGVGEIVSTKIRDSIVDSKTINVSKVQCISRHEQDYTQFFDGSYLIGE